jgi:hypothetical protein
MMFSARQILNESANRTRFVRKITNRFINATQQTLMFLGAATFVIISIMLVKPGFANQIIDGSAFSSKNTTLQKVHISQLENWVETTANPVEAIEEDEKILPIDQRQKQWVTNWISKRYRVANEATDMLVSAAYMTALEIKLDPLLILAVMAIESRFNPFAESPMGAQGLMQVMSKLHQEKFQNLGGIEAALDPVANIKVGSMILKEYVMRGGSVEQGLKSYVGAAEMESDSGYGAKVLSEYRKLKDVASGKKVPIATATASSASARKRAERMNAKSLDEQKIDVDSIPHEAKNDKIDKKELAQL